MSTTSPTDAVKLLAKRILEIGYDDLPARERHVIERVARRIAVSRDVSSHFEQNRTLGERLADRIAAFGGSWTFLMLFGLAIGIWIAINTVLLIRTGQQPFDPYPFILLNLFLSLIAAIQAPIIMMSQNRQSAKDRVQASHDYEVNLKAEIEIMALHEKMDELRQKDLQNLIQSLRSAQKLP
ncbi:DUF1003 domain-containing protein [Aestuariivirga sp.]|jgi:uncharacterized membrane protein|uniref:DUF1003 domain-containing protein n=1 Tax=Aestuariivirga sp. TaxID=2650926 RepID=UPI00378314C9